MAAIIFDFDGVIADSEIVSAEVFSEALSAMGLATTLEDAIQHYIGLNRVDSLAAMARLWGDRVPHDIAERLEAATAHGFAGPVQPVPGVAAFLARTDHLPRAIASSSSTDWLRRHLRDFGQAHRFGAHLYSGREHVTRGKPFPDLYLHAASALGVAPQQVLVIEDSPVGARAAVASGARVFGIAAGSHARPSITDALLAEGVERVFACYDEMAEVLGLA